MIRRSALAVLTALVIGILAIVPASAHVQVSSTGATRGGYGVLTFRVPTESDTASTTAVIIDFPTDTPITSVSVLPITGWSVTRTVKRLSHPQQTDDGQVDSYVARLSWKADSPRYAIGPGEFEMFSVSAGPLPDRASIAFPTTQRYSDGTTVVWDQVAAGQGAEPEHPAPVVHLPATAGQPGTASASASPTVTAARGDTATAPGDGGPDGLTVVAVVLAGIAVIVSVIAVLRTRRPA